jgi:hypothetical protein
MGSTSVLARRPGLLPGGLFGLDHAGKTAPLPILFLHIPKTAGTSMLTSLRNIFGDARVHRLKGDATLDARELNDIVAAGLDNISCVAGHLPLHLLRHHLGRFRACTMLREPVARVFSLYRFLRQADPAEQRRLGLAPNFSFTAFITCTTPELVAQINNGMCRMLSGDAAASDPEGVLTTSYPDTPGMLDNAVETLRRIDFGLVEAMDASRDLLARQWGLTDKPDAAWENTTDKTDASITVADLQSVIRRNQLDLALYAWATAEFPNRIASPVRSGTDRADSAFRPPLDLEVEIGAIPGRHGFHEVDPDRFCWLKSERPASLHFHAPEDSARIVLQLYCPFPNYDLTAIDVRLNGVRVPHTTHCVEPGWFCLETAHLPLASDLNMLTIDPPSFLSIRRIDPDSGDERYLSVALRSITLAR